MSDLLASLDAHLAARGTDITLRRVTGSAPSTVNHDITVRAAVRSYSPEELVGDIKQTDSQVIMSPTQILAAGWPGTGEVPSATVADPTLPRRLDRVVIAGRVRNIEVVDPIYVGNELVRLELRVLG